MDHISEYTYIVGIFSVSKQMFEAGVGRFGLDIFWEITKDKVKRILTYNLALDMDVEDLSENNRSLANEYMWFQEGINILKRKSENKDKYIVCEFHSERKITYEEMYQFIRESDHEILDKYRVNWKN